VVLYSGVVGQVCILVVLLLGLVRIEVTLITSSEWGLVFDLMTVSEFNTALTFKTLVATRSPLLWRLVFYLGKPFPR
jgi:hypothetical protein